MRDLVLEQTLGQTTIEDEELGSNPDLVPAEMANDRFVHRLLTAWTTILLEEKGLDKGCAVTGQLKSKNSPNIRADRKPAL